MHVHSCQKILTGGGSKPPHLPLLTLRRYPPSLPSYYLSFTENSGGSGGRVGGGGGDSEDKDEDKGQGGRRRLVDVNLDKEEEGGVRICPEVSSQCVRGGDKGRGRGNEEDDDNGDESNGDEVNGDVLQWSMATRNGAEIALAGYNWEVGRVVMSQWWACWVTERADGCCDFPLVLLSCLQKIEIRRVEQGCERKSSRSG